MANPAPLRCGVCGGEDFHDSDDGFFYCTNCGSQADDIIDTGVADEDFVDKTGHNGGGGGGALYIPSNRRTTQTHPQTSLFSTTPKSELHDYPADAVGPTGPVDFGPEVAHLKGVVFKEEDYHRVVRWRYVVGVQIMVQLQCEALVKRFGVNPIVCGIAASVWLRFVASTGVFADDWAYQTVIESESQGEKRTEGRRRYEGNLYSQPTY